MKITSVFENMEEIPFKYSGDGENINPFLEIEEIPEGTKSLAIILEDPDAVSGTFVHWLVWDILVSTTSMKIQENSKLGILGKNDAGEVGYFGPRPPKGSGAHHYFFKVYALNNILELKMGSEKNSLLHAMKGHLIDEAELVGIYEK